MVIVTMTGFDRRGRMVAAPLHLALTRGEGTATSLP